MGATVLMTWLPMLFLLSQATGRPVRVQLMREQEAGWEPKGTGQLIKIRGS